MPHLSSLGSDLSKNLIFEWETVGDAWIRLLLCISCQRDMTSHRASSLDFHCGFFLLSFRFFLRVSTDLW